MYKINSMFPLVGGIIILTSIYLVKSQISGQYRLCVPDVLFTVCQQMVADAASQGGRFECTPGNDKIDCLARVSKGEADLLVLEPEEVYVAHRFFHDAFYVATEIRTTARQAGSFQYEPVAIVRNSAQIRSLKDLQGKKSCHTAFGRTSGWEVPLARLMLKNVMVKDCSLDLTTVEREIASASHFFGESCVPGKWAPDDRTDLELKQRYPKLCQLCSNTRLCREDDKYSGFRGALRCLTENNGDISWTRLETVYQYFGNIPPSQQGQQPQPNPQQTLDGNNRASLSASEYSFLCPDGSSLPIGTTTPCTWAGRPWRSFIVTNRLSSPTTIADIQQQISLYRSVGAQLITGTPTVINWLGDILEFRIQDIEFHVPATVANTVTPLAYLDRGNYTMTIEKPTCPNRRTLRFCVRNEIEKLKCMAFRMASYGRRILPYFDCVVGESKEDCMRKIAIGQADFTSVDSREAYVASRKMRLTPILSEAERFGDEDADAARYAVAVVRVDSGIQTIVDLRGKRSCHGSVSSLTGWNIPLIVLRDSGLIYPQQCQFGRALASFFASSCVPGARDQNLQLPESLCSLCVGASLDAPALNTEENFCANNELEGFYGDLGAFRCLPTLAADVAFVDHLTPLLNTDGLANATWAAGLLSAQFRLVCPIGPSRAVTEFRQCHWGKIPADKVITGEDKDYVEREDIRLTLLKASETFHPEQTVLRLFGPFYGVPNLLFKDISTGLVPLTDEGFGTRRIDSYGRYVSANKDVVYDQQYAQRILRDVDDCNSSNVINQSILLLITSFILSCPIVFD